MKIIFLIFIILAIFCLIGIIKNFVTYDCHSKIGDAIYRYRIDCILNHR